MNISNSGYKVYRAEDIPENKLRALIFLLTYDNMREVIISDEFVLLPRFFNLDLGVEPINSTPRYIGNLANYKKFTMRFKPRNHQIAPIQHLIAERNGILNLACGLGKTYCALSLFAQTGIPTAVVVDKANLIHQWKDAIAEHIVEDVDVGIVKGNKWQWQDKRIVIISIGTLVSRLKKGTIPEGFFETFGLVIFDECHHLAANSLRKVAPCFKYQRVGLSATPNREDGNEEIIFNHLGPIIYSDMRQELIPDLYFVDVETSADLPLKVRSRDGEINHRRLCSYLGELQDRNEKILSIVFKLKSQGHKILCLTHSVEHVGIMESLFKERITKAVCGVSGVTPANQRKQLIEDSAISVATIDIAAEALDVPALSAVVITTPFGARTHGNILFQVLGRIQRKSYNKVKPIAVFIEDVNIGMCKNLMRQVRRRLKDASYNFTTNADMYEM